MDHARRIITKNRMRASIFVIRLWFQNGQSRPPAEYDKAPYRSACYEKFFSEVAYTLNKPRGITIYNSPYCSYSTVNSHPNHFPADLTLRRLRSTTTNIDTTPSAMLLRGNCVCYIDDCICELGMITHDLPNSFLGACGL